MKIAVIGEYRMGFAPHFMLNEALRHVEAQTEETIEIEWIDTLTISSNGKAIIEGYDGIWSAPGSPFKSLDGAVLAIQIAREQNIPHLGTCAGFQHTIIDIARNILGIEDAHHEEYDPDSSVLFVSQLACPLAGQKLQIKIRKGTEAFDAYRTETVEENYYCNFGINPNVKHRLEIDEIVWSGIDTDGEWRILEIPQNDFFVSTLFVPQTNSYPGKPHPLIKQFVRSAGRREKIRQKYGIPVQRAGFGIAGR